MQLNKFVIFVTIIHVIYYFKIFDYFKNKIYSIPEIM